MDTSRVHPARLPLQDQIRLLRETLGSNPVLVDVLNRAAAIALPGWYLTAGCLVQTVWNAMTGREPTAGIKDYDLFYFDDGDLSWAAEDAVIRSGADAFAGVAARLEIRNEARVHLWYSQRFGIPWVAPREVYLSKAARWLREWPELRVIPWPNSR